MEMESRHSAVMSIDLAGNLTFTGCFHSIIQQWASILVAWYDMPENMYSIIRLSFFVAT